MAEKGFGVKEVNLIGASGTPTITSPNNLNLNAVNVAISTNVSIGGTLSVTGNVSVGGTLTYEDVTSIDSVGIVTARTGVVTPNVDVDDFVTVGSNIQLGNAGVVTATTFSGSGASLTSIPAGQLTGTVADARISTLTASKLSGALPAISGANLTNLPAVDPTNSDIQVAYTVTANGSSAYRFAGNGVVSTADNPDLYLIRGQKYRFINNSGGSHPFQIREASGGTAYSTGVTNNGAASGNIDFAPTYDSPAQLVYQCTSHGGMVGNIYLRDAAGGNTNVGVTTFSSVVNISGNTNISSELRANGNIRITNAGPKITFVDSNNDSDFHIENADGSFEIRDITNGADRLRIASDGTTSLLSNVDVSGDLDVTGSTDGVLNLDTTDSRGSFIRFKENGTSKCFVGCGEGLSLGDQDDLGLRATDNIIFRAGSQEQMRIANDGFVSFGGDTDVGFIRSGTNTLQCKTNGTLCTEFAANQRVRMPQVYSTNGSNMRDVQIESDGTLCAGNTSVRAAKKNIASQTDVSWLYNLNPVTFNYRKHTVDAVTGANTYLEEIEEATSYGLIAEEVQTIKKDFCFYNDNELAGVDYKSLITPLLKALQEQKKEIDDLKAKVATLEGS